MARQWHGAHRWRTSIVAPSPPPPALWFDGVAARRRVDAAAVERVIFAMVARLSPTPLSKLAGSAWVARRVFIDGLAEVSDDACYRAMDFLLDALAELQEEVFFAVANLLNLEVACCSPAPAPPTGNATAPTNSGPAARNDEMRMTSRRTRPRPRPAGMAAARTTGPTCRRW